MSTELGGANGLLLLDKPAGITSHDLVARVRRALNTRKVGHAGTLDPMATGLMLVGVGTATRLLTYLVGDDKTYEATARLGVTTNTEDADGEVVRVADPARLRELTHDQLEDALAKFRGTIQQVPSAVSAIKVNGVRSYKRVRDGEQVELPPREVTIHELHLLGTEFTEAPSGDALPTMDVRLRVRCTAGTYIRALARDLGDALGVGAHLTELRRTEVGPYRLVDAADPEAPNLAERLLPPATVATKHFPSLSAADTEADALRNGRAITLPPELASTTGPIAALDASGELIGLITAGSDGRSKILTNLPQRGANE